MVVVFTVGLDQLLTDLEWLLALAACGLLDFLAELYVVLGGVSGGETQFLVIVDICPTCIQCQSLAWFEIDSTGGAGGLCNLENLDVIVVLVLALISVVGAIFSFFDHSGAPIIAAVVPGYYTGTCIISF